MLGKTSKASCKMTCVPVLSAKKFKCSKSQVEKTIPELPMGVEAQRALFLFQAEGG